MIFCESVFNYIHISKNMKQQRLLAGITQIWFSGTKFWVCLPCWPICFLMCWAPSWGFILWKLCKYLVKMQVQPNKNVLSENISLYCGYHESSRRYLFPFGDIYKIRHKQNCLNCCHDTLWHSKKDWNVSSTWPTALSFSVYLLEEVLSDKMRIL